METTEVKFLYVEDDALSRRVMSMLVINAMHAKHLVIFEDSHDFLHRLMQLEAVPDVILLDIHIQPHNGFEMLKMVRSVPDYSSTKVVALTASVMNEEIDRLRSSGFNGAIAKPISITTFPQLIEQIMQGSSVWHIG
jgi:CheY-like chemotaxis protein